MAKSKVKLDYKELEEFKKQLQKVTTDEQIELFLQSCAKELAARLLAKVIKRTPVGDYDTKFTGKIGGTLRRGWTGGVNQNGTSYAQSLPVRKVGTDYVIEVINPVEYASYVEFGHRQEVGRFVPAIGKKLVQPWVEGQFMLTISEDEIRNSAPQILEKKLNNYLKGCLK